RAAGALREALARLAQASLAQAAELVPLARALGVPPAPASPPGVATSLGTTLGEAFQAERTMEWVSRELVGLTHSMVRSAWNASPSVVPRDVATPGGEAGAGGTPSARARGTSSAAWASEAWASLARASRSAPAA